MSWGNSETSRKKFRKWKRKFQVWEFLMRLNFTDFRKLELNQRNIQNLQDQDNSEKLVEAFDDPEFDALLGE